MGYAPSLCSSRLNNPTQRRIAKRWHSTMPKPKQTVRLSALPPAPTAGADAQALADWVVLFYRNNVVACLMLGTMSPKLYQQFEHNSPLEMVTELQKIFILNSLSSEFQAFVQNYNMQSMDKTIMMAIEGGRVQKYKPQGKAKGKGKGKGKGLQNSYLTKTKKPQPYKKEHPEKERTLEKELSCVSS
ncbi:hypothetical protein Tco_1369938 [Tanacetum coccineum]